MIVQCPSCAAKFRVADEKIKPAGVKVRCGRCKTIFRVRLRRVEDDPTVERDMPARRPASPSDHEATRVVFDPVAEALVEHPTGDNPLYRTNPASPNSFSPPTLDDDLPYTDSELGSSSDLDGFPSDVGLLGSGGDSPPGAAMLRETALRSESHDPSRGRRRSNTFYPPIDETSATFDDSLLPPVTGDHGHGPATQPQFEPPDYEPSVDASSDALNALGDPLPLPDLDWDVEKPDASTSLTPGLSLEPGELPPIAQTGGGRNVTWTPPDTPIPDTLPPFEPPAPDDWPEPAPLEEPAPVRASDGESEVEGPPAPFQRVPTSAELLAAVKAPRPVADVSRADVVARWLAGVLAVVLVAVGFLLFLAAQNDWLLDLKALDQMIGVAFEGAEYEPRMVRTVRVYELDGRLVEEPFEGAGVPADLPLQVRNVEQSLYRTQNDAHLVVIEGDLLNTDSRPHRGIFVSARLSEGGRSVAELVAPVGRTLSQEEFETIVAEERLEALYGEIAEEAASLVINANQRSRFSLVFPRFEGAWAGDQMSYTVEVVQAEVAGDDGVWRRLIYDPELAPQGTPTP